ncbi:unnamed protein product [Phytomonas sp. Hart1]|nr:unnamed protein product [Phytomonas sp. Hart1]|eukprot:CCW68881.1 unnamed protein product [Phytomonas sp. isolate Hart1]
MGVHGLWRLLDTFGEVTQPEIWCGCRVAIDASIWIAQFRSRASSDDVNNKIIQGFFLRILKLLFYGIEPVFVFDGPTSALKAKEHRRRQTLRRIMEQSVIKRQAQKIVSALLSSGNLNLSHLKREREPNGDLTEALEIQGRRSRIDPKDAALLHYDSQKIGMETSLGYQKDHLFFSENPNGISDYRNRSRPIRRRRLAPTEVSKATMMTFLKEAEDLIEQRKKGEQCVLHNTLRYSSSSLFMGPRCALLSEKENKVSSSFKALDGALPDIVMVDEVGPCQNHADVLLIDTEDDSSEASLIALSINSSQAKREEGALLSPPSVAISEGNTPTKHSNIESGPSHTKSRDGALARSAPAMPFSAVSPSETAFAVPSGDPFDRGAFNAGDSLASVEGSWESSTSDVESSDGTNGEGAFMAASGTFEASFLWDPSTQRQREALAAVLEVHKHQMFFEIKPQNDDKFPRVVHDLTAANRASSGTAVSRSGAVLACTAALNRQIPPLEYANPPFSTTREGLVGDFPPNPANSGGDSPPKGVPFELSGIIRLLGCFGISYVISPGEADAQCAYLARQGLVDAVFTEDSDVVVHGAPVILRGFFSSNQKVLAYRQAELVACGVDKGVLVALALLLGCDYAEGIAGLGLSGALEVLVSSWLPTKPNEKEEKDNFHGEMGFIISVLRRWKALVAKMPTSWVDVGEDDLSLLQFLLLEKNKRSWGGLHLPASFPESNVVGAFYEPPVNRDRTPFLASNPQWPRVWQFAGENGLLESSWVRERLGLAQKEWDRRQKQNMMGGTQGEKASRSQRCLEEFGVRTKLGERWAYKKQPLRLSAVLAQLRGIQKLGADVEGESVR